MKKILYFLILFALLPIVTFAADITVINPNLPGGLSNPTSPGGYIIGFYNYALFICGLLAFGVIIYGGIRYAISRGNPSGETDAKQWIYGALLGMLLLAAAYLILYTVNPNLVNLDLGALPKPTTP